ncbi:hypothetical protein Hanom_Chr12g01094971 [Helianthus anomalus]
MLVYSQNFSQWQIQDFLSSYLRYSSFDGGFNTLNHSLPLGLRFHRRPVYMSNTIFL